MGTTTPAPDPAAPDFDPVPTRTRHDGWTPEKQHDFIAALAEAEAGMAAMSRT